MIRIAAALCKIPWLLAITFLAFSAASAHAQNGSIKVGTGTLKYTYYINPTVACYDGTYSETTFSNFSYVVGSTTYTLTSGGATEATEYSVSTTDPGGCPPAGQEPAVLALSLPAGVGGSAGQNCTIDFTNGGSATISCSAAPPPPVSGYINPKYLIVGVTYAPPGASSYVTYCNNSTVSETNSIASTFKSSYQEGVKVTVSAGLFGWAKGSTTASTSTTYSQTSKTSNSVTVSQSTSLCTKTPGGANNYKPNNHDYDIIWLWLNPVVLLQFQDNTNGTITGTTWKGYGYSTLDQPAMDVYPVYVGWLNGDLTMTASESKPLARAWAAGEVWPSGQGPALTSTGTNSDYSKILLADPYGQCTPHPTQCPTSINPDRYTITDNQDIPFVQPPSGGQPINETYMLGYTASDTQSTDYTTENSVTFGLETSFSATPFVASVTTTFSSSNTFTWTNETNTSLTSTNSTTATASVTGAPCVVSGNSCNPIYTGASEFDVYEDNLYGTFFFNPVN